MGLLGDFERALKDGASMPEVPPGKSVRAGDGDPGADECPNCTNKMRDHKEPERDGGTPQASVVSSSGSSGGTAAAAESSLTAAVKPKMMEHVLILTACTNLNEYR